MHPGGAHTAEGHALPVADAQIPKAAREGEGGVEGEEEEDDDDGFDIQIDEPEAAPEEAGSEVRSAAMPSAVRCLEMVQAWFNSA